MTATIKLIDVEGKTQQDLSAFPGLMLLNPVKKTLLLDFGEFEEDKVIYLNFHLKSINITYWMDIRGLSANHNNIK